MNILTSTHMMQRSKEHPTEAEEPATAWQLFGSPAEAWDAMYRDCERAQRSIEFEQYILENDAVGRRFLELFTRKAGQGVRVVLICDAFGSRSLYRTELVRRFRAAGGVLRFFRILKWWDIFRPWRWFPRTHAKTLLLDSEIAYTGGVCIDERMQGWRDTHIRITGPVARQIRRAFDEFERGLGYWRKPPLRLSQSGEDGFYYLEHRPSIAHYPLYCSLLSAIERSERSVYIATAFFVPGRRFSRRLVRAARRGVDVRVMVPERSDVRLADWICLTHVKKLLDAGVRFYLYKPTVLHSKVVVVDRGWACLGSMNMDLMSFFHNREASLVATQEELVSALQANFFHDMKECIEVTPEYLAAVPFWKKIAGYAGRSLKWFF